MRVLLSTHDSCGASNRSWHSPVRLRELGAEVQVCAPPDCLERLAEVGVPRRRPTGPARLRWWYLSGRTSHRQRGDPSKISLVLHGGWPESVSVSPSP